MIFHPRQKKINVNVPLTLENTVIKQVTQTKFLVFSLISIQTLYLVLLLCMSFLKTYCNVAWSSTYCSNVNCIYLLQKRIVRLITKAHCLANTAPLFSQLKVLDIFSINSFSVASFMYSYHHNLLPSSFGDLFLRASVCKILISSFAHKIDFAHNFSVDFF